MWLVVEGAGESAALAALSAGLVHCVVKESQLHRGEAKLEDRRIEAEAGDTNRPQGCSRKVWRCRHATWLFLPSIGGAKPTSQRRGGGGGRFRPRTLPSPSFFLS